MEWRGESLLGVPLPKRKLELLFCQGLCSRAAALLQRREFWSSSQPPCGCARPLDLQRQPQPCPELGCGVLLFSEAGGSSWRFQRGSSPGTQAVNLEVFLLCSALSGAWHCVCSWART